jgi:hypothetical protein
VFYSLLIVAAIGAGIFTFKKWQTLPEAKRGGFGKKAVLWAAIAVILGLVLAGRAHWLMGVLAALLGLAGRVAQFAQYVPLFKKLFGEPDSPPSQGAATQTAMSKQEAADILGVEVSASKEEVRMAHKKLMQKIHPDRGGSDALAKQINHAKSTLLG